jgi:hypothetical protein
MENQIIIEKFIRSSEENAISILMENENIKPFVSILTKDDDEYGQHNIPIPPMFLEGESGKDFVREILINGLKKKLKEEGREILCVNWVSEGWMYVGKKGEDDVENYRELPRKEVLLMTFDCEDQQIVSTYEIKRSGWKVGESGLDKGLELIPIEQDFNNKNRKGRFGNLFKD